MTLVEATDQVMAPLDREMVEPVHEALRSAGVDLLLGASVAGIDAGSAGVPVVHLSDGRAIPTGLVVAAIGVRPETSLAQEAGLAIGERGGILVDEHLRTSDPAIFAVGDAVEKRDGLDASATLVPLANTANRQGRVVADVIVGRPGADRPLLGTAIVEVLGVAAASVGWTEKRLRAAGRPHRVLHTHPGSHAGYYPGAETMAIKLLVDPSSDAILGAQAVGRDGVDKRVDVIATAMAGGLTAGDLADLELAYAPQFGSAKDPVNMLGWVDRAVADGDVVTLQWHELDDALAAGATLVDVRSPAEHGARPIPGALNVPVDELRARLDELPGGPLVVHCEVGLRGYVAARVLAQHGRDVRNLDGGYRTWAAGTAATLGDADAFAPCLDFLDANRALAPSLVFEFRQNAYRSFGAIEHEGLAALADLGFRFSLDHVTDLRIEPKELFDRGFRFLKTPAKLLLNKAAAGQSDIDAADLSNLLARFSIELIAERIESENMVVDLLDYDVKFGQGFLFSPPRPVRPEALHGQTPPGDPTAASGATPPSAPPSGPAAMPQATALGGARVQKLAADDPASVLAAPDFVPQNMPA